MKPRYRITLQNQLLLIIIFAILGIFFLIAYSGMVIVPLVLLILLGMAWYIINYKVFRAIAALKDVADTFVHGDYTQRMSDKVSGTELADLAHSFDELATRVASTIASLQQSDAIVRQSEQRFRSYVENANDVVFSLTPEGVFSYVSPQWKEAFGYELEETIGKPFIPFVHPDDVAGCFDFLTKVMATGQKQPGVEYRVLHKNGAWLWYKANGSRIMEHDGSLSFIGIGRNITEQKLVHNELIKAQKLESLSVLAAGIAHNFNNVLTGVIGYISFSRRHVNNPEKIAPLLEAAEKSSNRAASLARQLLTFAKGGAPYKQLNSPKELVQESLSLFLSGTNVKGELQCCTENLVFVDSHQINQAFNNIVLNALHAMKKGGMLTVRISALQLEADNVQLLKQGTYVQFVFEDGGCGIAPEHLDKIFDPYFTTRPNGSGLGLPTTHAIISKHGGYVGIASQPGHGTAVTVLLPAFQNVPSEQRSEQQITKSEGAIRESILFMDDEEDIRDLANKHLEEAGYQVTTCRTGDEAVKYYLKCWEQGTSLPIVILDILVPDGMGGDEAARQILSINPMARLIVSSGYSNIPIMSEYQKYGFCDVLQKPYTSEDLLHILARVSQPAGKSG